MDYAQLEDHFVNAGGEFITSSMQLSERMQAVRAYLYDWDGVFNNGCESAPGQGSGYSAVSAAGVFLLRLGHYLRHGEVPRMAIITGEVNPQAQAFAERLGFDAAYVHTRQKAEALEHFREAQQLEASQLVYVFDDVLDVPVARQVGLRLAVGRLCNPLYMDYLLRHQLVDYISACEGQEHAVREFSELLLALLEVYDEAVEERLSLGERYQAYLRDSAARTTSLYRWNKSKFVKI